MINSPGGCCFSGFSIVDAIRGSRLPVRTVASGLVASMGLLIAMAGEPGQRCITGRTMVLSHQWSGGTVGKSSDLKASNAMREIEDAMFMSHYRDCTGLSEQVIRERLLPPQDVYLSPRDAIRLNLFDKVIDALA